MKKVICQNYEENGQYCGHSAHLSIEDLKQYLNKIRNLEFKPFGLPYKDYIPMQSYYFLEDITKNGSVGIFRQGKELLPSSQILI